MMLQITDEANRLGLAMLEYLTGPLQSALNDFPCARVQVIGHSLGGVMAELFVSSTSPKDVLPVNEIGCIFQTRD